MTEHDHIPPEKLDRYRELAEQDYLGQADETMVPYLESTFDQGYNPTWYYFDRLGMFGAPHRKDLGETDLLCVGVPLDIGTPNQRTGSRLGPRELRKWSKNQGPRNVEVGLNPFEQCRIADWGDVDFRRNPYDLAETIVDLTDRYEGFHEADVVPFSVGGEHTITYPILKALGADRPLGLVHLDAHSDTRTGAYHGAPVNDANVFTQAVADGVLDPERTVQIGIRGRVLATNEFSHETGMRTVPAVEFQERGPESVAEIAREVVGDGPCYLTIDTDVFDPSAMPGTTLPEPFGLTGREVRDFLRAIRGLDVRGADLVELSPNYDSTGQSGCLAAGIAFEALTLLADARAERIGERNRTEWPRHWR